MATDFGGCPMLMYQECYDAAARDSSQKTIIKLTHAQRSRIFVINNGLLMINGKYVLLEGEPEWVFKEVHEKMGHLSVRDMSVSVCRHFTYIVRANGILARDVERAVKNCERCRALRPSKPPKGFDNYEGVEIVLTALPSGEPHRFAISVKMPEQKAAEGLLDNETDGPRRTARRVEHKVIGKQATPAVQERKRCRQPPVKTPAVPVKRQKKVQRPANGDTPLDLEPNVVHHESLQDDEDDEVIVVRQVVAAANNFRDSFPSDMPVLARMIPVSEVKKEEVVDGGDTMTIDNNNKPVALPDVPRDAAKRVQGEKEVLNKSGALKDDHKQDGVALSTDMVTNSKLVDPPVRIKTETREVEAFVKAGSPESSIQVVEENEEPFVNRRSLCLVVRTAYGIFNVPAGYTPRKPKSHGLKSRTLENGTIQRTIRVNLTKMGVNEVADGEYIDWDEEMFTNTPSGERYVDAEDYGALLVPHDYEYSYGSLEEEKGGDLTIVFTATMKKILFSKSGLLFSFGVILADYHLDMVKKNNNSVRPLRKEGKGSKQCTVVAVFGGCPRDLYQDLYDYVSNPEEPEPDSNMNAILIVRSHICTIEKGLLMADGKYVLVEGEPEWVLKEVHEKMGHLSVRDMWQSVRCHFTYVQQLYGSVTADLKRVLENCTLCKDLGPFVIKDFDPYQGVKITLRSKLVGEHRIVIDVEMPVTHTTKKSPEEEVCGIRRRSSRKRVLCADKKVTSEPDENKRQPVTLIVEEPVKRPKKLLSEAGLETTTVDVIEASVQGVPLPEGAPADNIVQVNAENEEDDDVIILREVAAPIRNFGMPMLKMMMSSSNASVSSKSPPELTQMNLDDDEDEVTVVRDVSAPVRNVLMPVLEMMSSWNTSVTSRDKTTHNVTQPISARNRDAPGSHVPNNVRQQSHIFAATNNIVVQERVTQTSHIQNSDTQIRDDHALVLPPLIPVSHIKQEVNERGYPTVGQHLDQIAAHEERDVSHRDIRDRDAQNNADVIPVQLHAENLEPLEDTSALSTIVVKPQGTNGDQISIGAEDPSKDSQEASEPPEGERNTPTVIIKKEVVEAQLHQSIKVEPMTDPEEVVKEVHAFYTQASSSGASIQVMEQDEEQIVNRTLIVRTAYGIFKVPPGYSPRKPNAYGLKSRTIENGTVQRTVRIFLSKLYDYEVAEGECIDWDEEMRNGAPMGERYMDAGEYGALIVPRDRDVSYGYMEEEGDGQMNIVFTITMKWL